MANNRALLPRPEESCQSDGGRMWWATFDFIRMNIGPIILRNQIEDRMEMLDSTRFCRTV